MIKERKIDGEPRLVIPESLKPRPDQDTSETYLRYTSGT